MENKTFDHGCNLMQNNSMHKLHWNDNESSENISSFNWFGFITQNDHCEYTSYLSETAAMAWH